jgi:hypothetical protein
MYHLREKYNYALRLKKKKKKLYLKIQLSHYKKKKKKTFSGHGDPWVGHGSPLRVVFCFNFFT